MDNLDNFLLDKFNELCYNLRHTGSESILTFDTEYGIIGRRWPIYAIYGHLKRNIGQVLYDWNRKRVGCVRGMACLREGVAYRLNQGKWVVNTRLYTKTFA